MDRKKLKKPSDYPQYSIRLSTVEEKTQLDQAIKEVVDLYNTNLKEDERIYTKKEIVLMALEVGLEKLKKQKSDYLFSSSIIVPRRAPPAAVNRKIGIPMPKPADATPVIWMPTVPNPKANPDRVNLPAQPRLPQP